MPAALVPPSDPPGTSTVLAGAVWTAPIVMFVPAGRPSMMYIGVLPR